jgi:ribonucleotide reductase alpha subunit
MFVIKRSGQKVPMRYDSITDRNIELSKDLDIDVAYLSKMVIQSLKNSMTTTEIDELAAETAAYMSSYEPDYDVLAARIAISNHQKSTSSSFFETMKQLSEHINKDTGRKSNVINEHFMKFVETHKDIIEQNIDYSKDFNYSYFGFKTLQRLYLLKVGKTIVERPQHMLMRVACSIYSTTNGGGNITRAIRCYKDMAEGYYTHASPTLFNSGSSRQQLSSCFLLDTDDDLKHIYETNLKCALISKHGGGIGVNITKVRAKGSTIHSTNGISDGIIPMIKVFNATAVYANQAGKRKGSIAMYLEPWHPDVVEFLALRYNQPPEELRARDIFLALWVNDLFMKRVEEDGIWSLFCPSVVPQLAETYGEEFEQIYLQAEQDKKYMKQMKARELFEKITHAQIETGLPYILYKDSVNKKNMQENIGIIRSSNLCVSGDTKILTKQGHIEINKLVNKETEIWNGFEWSTVIPKQTGENQPLLEVELSNGIKIKCTEYHKFPIVNNPEDESYELIEAIKLDKGQCLLKYSFPEDTTNIKLTIKSINILDGLHDTFCFTENKRNLGMFNGVLLGNCAEILEVTNGSSTAVCNLASISLPKYVRYIDGQPDIDYDKLYQITKTIVRNIDNIIDINYYPIEEAKKNNTDYRPMGIGIQGLADVFAMFKAPWGSPVADTINRYIFECIYYAAVEASHELALERGSYSAFEGSPYSKGILQYHLWNETPKSVRWNWKGLEEKVKRGMRNSLLIALMPTASSSQILGNNEAAEAFTSNLYSRSTLAGDFIILNKHLVKDLKELKLWNKYIVNKIIENDGSIQLIDEISDDLKEVYKTVWEIKQSIIVKYAAMRAPFVDQTQSMNIFFEHPTNRLLSSLHMMGWKAGLKTGNYYIRSKPSRNAVKFTILKENKGKEYVKDGKKMICTEDICVACSS